MSFVDTHEEIGTSVDGGAVVSPRAVHAPARDAGDDYRAMVCLFLFGGNDANNLLVPTDSRHALYQRQRPNLAIPREALLPLALRNVTGESYGLHPALGGLQRLVNGGHASLVANVGPLVIPITREEWLQSSVPVPQSLFGHGEQQDAWQSSLLDVAPRSGWGGRLIERLVGRDVPGRPYSMLNVSGPNLWATGDRGLHAQRVDALNNPLLMWRGAPGSERRAQSRLVREASTLPSWMDVRPAHPFGPDLLTEAMNSNQLLTQFPDSTLGRQLKAIAYLIAAREPFGVTKQCFFCAMRGFDTHGDEQLQRQQESFAEIGAAVAAFHAATVELGIDQQVTLFSASDFGRTLASNGLGTDHGWGSHHFVVGGAVRGGRLIGTFPDLTLEGPDDAGNGAWIPTTSTDQLTGDIARWFGADADTLHEVFPNLCHFDEQIGLMV